MPIFNADPDTNGALIIKYLPHCLNKKALIISTISANPNNLWVKEINKLAHVMKPPYIAVPFRKGMKPTKSKGAAGTSIRDTKPIKSDILTKGNKLIRTINTLTCEQQLQKQYFT